MPITKGIHCAYCSYSGTNDFEMQNHYALIHEDEKEILKEHEKQINERRDKKTFNFGY